MRKTKYSPFLTPIWLGLLGLALGLVLAVSAFAIGRALRPSLLLRGAMLNPPVPAVDFSLTDGDGQSITLYEFRGQPVLLTFSCKACSGSGALLSKLSLVRNKAASRGHELQIIVINLNPEREPSQVYAEFVHAVDTKFVPVSGELRDITDIAHSYDIYFGSSQNASVESSPLIFLIDAQGYWRSVYPLNMNAADISSDIEIIWQDQ